jgi:hypothetical protein
MLLCIIRLEEERLINGSKTKWMLAKDVETTKHDLSIWSPHFHKMEKGYFYRLSNLIVDKYPSSKPHRIRTWYSTKVEIATSEEVQMMQRAGIGLYDGSYTGTVVTLGDVGSYLACAKCNKSIKDIEVHDKCMKCGTQVSGDEAEDFRAELILDSPDSKDDEDFVSATVFKNLLIRVLGKAKITATVLNTEEYITKKITGLHVRAWFNKSKAGCIVEDIDILPQTEH